MKRNVLIFGMVLGTLLCINMIYAVNLCYTNPEFEPNDILGYAVMVVIFSITFFGIRNYRDKELDGFISFGKAFKTGVLIVFVASTAYVVVWLFYYYLFVPDFLDQYTLHVLADATRSGASPEKLAAKTEEMKDFKEMYKSTFFVIAVTYVEVLPVGLVVALVSSLILKRKPE